VEDQEHQVVSGQEPYFRNQAIQAVHAFLRRFRMHQSVADPGYNVRAVHLPSLALALLRRKPRGHWQENWIDDGGNFRTCQSHAEKVMRAKASALVSAPTQVLILG
jgi:hypothetical protein